MCFRLLYTEEIRQLQAQGCECEDWSMLEVAQDFRVDYVRNVRFSGKIRLGSFERNFTVDGINKHSGIFNATLHNCTIADNVYISNVQNHIANYDIGQETFIENIHCLAVTEQTAFGNGTMVSVLDETGSRSIPIYRNMSAQAAHILVFYRHHEKALQQLLSLIEKQVSTESSDRGSIGSHSRIVNCGTIKNVYIGSYAGLEGIALLENGSIDSSEQAKGFVGYGVIARDFIFAAGASVFDGAQIERCFVDNGTVLGKQFVATDSLFFANCQMLCGEAAAIFAAPYTVSHHKSTLLIGGTFSFFNAGSAANQSNHAYKLGAMHYGHYGRGSKMGSGAYLLLPSRCGVFSVILGKHARSFDASLFPFSYIVAGKKGETIVLPAQNLQSIGASRDAKKWAERDTRKGEKSDIIHTEMLNPYTISRIIAAHDVLQNCLDNKHYHFEEEGFTLKDSCIERALALYRMAIDIYRAQVLANALQHNTDLSMVENTKMYPDWVDLAGMIAPHQEVELLLAKDYNSLDEWQQAFNKLNSAYSQWELAFAVSLREKTDLHSILQNGISAEEKRLALLLGDAQKEYVPEKQICFGIDQSENCKAKEFSVLKGKVEDNSFVKNLQEETAQRIEMMRSISSQYFDVKDTVLDGSYGKGTQTENSHIDIAVAADEIQQFGISI